MRAICSCAGRRTAGGAAGNRFHKPLVQAAVAAETSRLRLRGSVMNPRTRIDPLVGGNRVISILVVVVLPARSGRGGRNRSLDLEQMPRTASTSRDDRRRILSWRDRASESAASITGMDRPLVYGRVSTLRPGRTGLRH